MKRAREEEEPSIFDIMPSELMGVIRAGLGARERIMLQRTCRVAHKHDPGLILDPLWRKAWTIAPTPQMQHDVLFVLQQVDALGILDTPWPILHDCCFTQVCERDEASWTPDFIVYWSLRDNTVGINTATVDIDYVGADEMPWRLSFFFSHDEIFHDEAPTLAALLERHPRLYTDLPFNAISKSVCCTNDELFILLKNREIDTL